MSATRAVYKQSLGTMDMVCFQASKDAKMLAVQNQRGNPTIWYETDVDPKTFTYYHVGCVGTGETFPRPTPFGDEFVYYGTVQVSNDKSVWHYYGDMPRV